MVKKNWLHLLVLVLLSFAGTSSYAPIAYEDNRFISYVADTKKQPFQLYWKNDQGKPFRSIASLKEWLGRNKKRLVFAMNAGMYKPDGSPQGLFIENGIVRTPIDTSSGSGNFYLKPNGIFYTTKDGTPRICKTPAFVNNGTVRYATQSGPLLVIDDQIHPAFNKTSVNLNVRNGVGILPGNKILFAMSKKEINFYEFAGYFKNKGCRWALYLDGLVSRTYLPEKGWTQMDGNFGVIIGVVVDEH